MDRNEIINKIIELEWLMFSSVNNHGGKAACQFDQKTFRIMRSSQYKTWSNELLKSYADDLEKARDENRNLMTEKYARMMENNFPDEYSRLAEYLKPVDPETNKKINEIISIHICWKEELDNKYPFLGERGRLLHSSDDTPYSRPSLETYMRSELRNLSKHTINIYYAETLLRKRENRNEAEENLLNQIHEYGFNDLDSANNYFANFSLSGLNK